MNRLFSPLALLGVLVAAPMAALADTAVVGFDDISPGLYAQNFASGGFRFSPNCHADIVNDPSEPGGNRMGYDTAGCGQPQFTNPNPLSPNPIGANVYVDYFGASFSLLSFSHIGSPGYVLSSKGGRFDFTIGTVDPIVYSPFGSEWQDVQWVEFGGNCSGAPCIRLDDLTFNVAAPVPEPEALAMMALGFGLVAYAAGNSNRRRRGRTGTQAH
jgi:hypothetical protein